MIVHRAYGVGRWITVVVSVAVSFGMVARAGVEVPEPPPKAVEVTFERPADAGAVRPGDPVSRVMVVTNHASSPLRVRMVQATCACLTIEPRQAVVAPGATVRIVVGTIAIEAAGRQEHAAAFDLTLQEGDAPPAWSSRETVAFSYTPDIEASVQPMFIAVQGVAGEPLTARVWVRRPDGSRPELLESTPPGDWVRVRSFDPAPDQESLAWLHLDFSTAQPGVHRGLLPVRVKGEADVKNRVDVSVRVEPAFYATPPDVVRRGLPDDEGSRREHVLRIRRTRGDLDPRLTPVVRVEPATAGIDVAPLQFESGAWELRVTTDLSRLLAAGASCGQASVRLLSEHGEELASIPVVWFDESLWAGPARP